MSLRRRLTILTSLTVAVAVGIFAVVATIRTRSVLEARTAEELSVLTSGMMAPARNQLTRVAQGRKPNEWKAFRQVASPETNTSYARLLLADGDVIPLPSIAPEDVPVPEPPADAMNHSGAGVFTVAAPDGTEFSAAVTPIPDGDAAIYVALADRRTSSAISELLRTYEWTGAALIVVFVALIFLVIRLGLRPLEEVTSAARAIKGHGTDSHIPEGRPGTEVGELTAALNQMLDALGAMSERTTRFASDAAHELRTPVTAILGYAELYQRGAIEGTERLDEVFGRIEHESRRLAELVEGLLLLDRLEAGGTAGHQLGDDAREFDLGDLCAEAAADSMAIDERHEIEMDCPDAILMKGHRDGVFQVVANLLSNVRDHTPDGTRCVIGVSRQPGDRATGPGDTAGPGGTAGRRWISIRVSDDGPGLPQGFEGRAFDRFTQGSDGRAARKGGSGLGLAIARAVVDEHGGTVAMATNGSGGATVTVNLPGSLLAD